MKSFDYLVLSDVHLGHRKTSTKFILKNLYELFQDFSPRSRFRNVKIIFVAGDLFDRRLDHTSSDYVEILVFIARLFHFAKDYGIKIRFMEGTPSHDWKQYSLLRPMSSLVKEGLDFRYVDNLEIEHMADLGINILYVPDEWRPTAEETLLEVKDLLKAKGLEKVTIAIMHGMFKYQVHGIPLKDSILAAVHDEQEYLSLVERYINIGHVHKFSFFERIVAQGSTDRISHGEEEPKGLVLMTIDEDKRNDRFVFIQNKGAKIYKSISVDGLDLEQAMAKFDKETKGLPLDSHVRIISRKNHPIVAGLRELQIARSDYNITIKTLEDLEEEGNLIQSKTVIDTTYTPITITRDNVNTLILEGVMAKYSLSSDELNQLNSLLEELHV